MSGSEAGAIRRPQRSGLAKMPTELGHSQRLAVRWKNFRGFTDSGWILLKPLTILLGANGSGKSSVIEPLLLMKQSMISRTGSSALLTSGEYAESGTYADLVRCHDQTKHVEFDIHWHSHADQDDLEPVGVYEPGGAAFAFQQQRGRDDIDLFSYRVSDIYLRRMISRQLRTDGKRYTLNVPKSVDDDGVVSKAGRRAMRESRPVDFLFKSNRIRRAELEAEADDDAPRFDLRLEDPMVRLYCQAVDYVMWELQDITERIYFLGPLRERPKRVYERLGEMPPDVGTRGEHAPEVIYRWRKNKAHLKELHKWLVRFGINDRIDWKDVGPAGFSLHLDGGQDPPTSFVDAGFGMSQVLPLIVQSLMLPKRSWLITEQPEIHLNPRLQTELADLLVDVANRGSGAIVETHSEHLLLRLRNLVAAGEISSDQVALYFVEREGDRSIVREVPIEDSGRIDPKAWPAGFFEDSLREALSLADNQARARKRTAQADA